MSDDLNAFGWSGRTDYTGGHCRLCNQRMPFHGKRDYRCESCAQIAYDEWRRIQDCPLICDADWGDAS